MNHTEKIGFIGQGWIGRNYADNFVERGFTVVRYALEEPYLHNKAEIKECQVVFVAVPTPTTPDGFNYEAVKQALAVIKTGSSVVIKSTLLPGTTNKLQNEFPHLFIFHSPEFLREKTAAHDAAHPERNIVGVPKNTIEHLKRAEEIMSLLPVARFSKIMTATEAELVKYAGNGFLYTKVTFMNMMYDVASQLGASWAEVSEAVSQDQRIGSSHMSPVHRSGHLEDNTQKVERGAGGHCFIKDYEALKELYLDLMGNDEGYQMLTSTRDYNLKLLHDSQKDLDLIRQVYGN